MSEYSTREFDAYRADDAALRAILDRADEEKRGTTAEEDEQIDKLFDSATSHKNRAERIAEHEADAVRMSELADEVRSRIGDVSTVDSGDPATPPRKGSGDDSLLEAIRAAQEHINGQAAEPFTERVLTLPADEAYWIKPLHEAVEEVRAIANFSDGSKLWVADFSTRVAVFQRTMSPWFNIASIINADNGRQSILPNISADPGSSAPGEGTAISPTDPTLGTAVIDPVSHKTLSYISAEAEEDEVIGYLPLLARVQGRSVGFRAGTAMTATILTGASNGGTASGVGGDGTATVAFFGYEDLLDLKYGRAAPYRDIGVWVAANGAIKKIRKFKDQNRQYYWQPAIALGQPATFDGDPIYEDPGLATPASATKSVLFGDPQSVVIKQVPLRVAVSTEFKFDTDQVAVKSVLRAGAAVWDAAGIAYLVSANS